MRVLGASALAAALLLSGCASLTAPAATTEGSGLPAVAALLDPLAAGPLAFATAPYDAGEVVVGGPDAEHADYEYDARVRGQAWWPESAGSYPVLVFLHGQHQTCAFLGRDDVFLSPDDCSDDEGLNTPYPNHMGYEYLASHLASHGYVVLSILAHEVNQRNGGDEIGMWARGELILATLDALRDAADGMPAEAVARADLARVGLMGHSRGGEGVVTASHVNLARPEDDRHALRGIVALAPTDFNARGVAGVALLSLVPYCDGDVSTLHGLRTFDHSRLLDDATPKVQVLVRGTNHNFYNTRWYDELGAPVRPGDDALFSPLGLAGSCGREREAGGWRWTPEETQRQSLVHVGGFLRWSVGDETGLAPWATGELALPEGACPAGAAPCEETIVVSAVLPGARRLAIVGAQLPANLTLEGFDDARVCAASDCGTNVYSAADAVDLRWSGEATARVVLAEPQDWSGLDAFAFRVANPAAATPPPPAFDLAVEIVTPGGVARVDVGDAPALDPTPDPRVETPATNAGVSKVALQAVRVPLAGLAVDLRAVQEVRLVFTGEGRVLLTDLLAQAEPDVE